MPPQAEDSTSPSPANVAKSSLRSSGLDYRNGMSTHRKTNIPLSGIVKMEGSYNRKVRLKVWVSRQSNRASGWWVHGNWVNPGQRSTARWNVDPDTHYYLWVHAESQQGVRSGATGAHLWSERSPQRPGLINPPENATYPSGVNIRFEFSFEDRDSRPKDDIGAVQVRWRLSSTLSSEAGPWDVNTWYAEQFETSGGGGGSPANRGKITVPADGFNKNLWHDWQIRARDTHGMWSGWSESRSLFVVGAETSPRLLYPTNEVAVPVDEDVIFYWEFRPSTQSQYKADLRYRAAGTTDWTTIPGDQLVPGANQEYRIPANVLAPGVRYEWQARTYSSVTAPPSDWSGSAFFWAVFTPGSSNDEIPIPSLTEPQGCLGQGAYRVFVYDQGGQRLVGEVKPTSIIRWSRLRDDISDATVYTAGFGEDCCEMLANIHSWSHELVIFRDGERVWEGPITRLAFHDDGVEIAAKDPMAYLYRRIMRQGYNDGRFYRWDRSPYIDVAQYRARGQIRSGSRSAIDRAALIITQALAPYDPNVLPWLVRYDFDDDAHQSRRVADWSKTAFEEVDSLAATAGIDYTTAGRRIILHDTHRPIGILAEMRNGDFDKSPIITEYGMNAANVFGVTSNGGIWGSFEFPRDEWYGFGPIEQLASAYGETAATGNAGSLTRAEERRKRRELSKQATRNISGRWMPGPPVVVRIPDNSRISPTAPIGIQQLIPGVHIPLRATTICKEYAQMQKLDAVNVEVREGTENVKVVMSPAPLGNLDPDADQTAEEG